MGKNAILDDWVGVWEGGGMNRNDKKEEIDRDTSENNVVTC